MAARRRITFEDEMRRARSRGGYRNDAGEGVRRDIGGLAAHLGSEVDWGDDYTCPGTCGECTNDFYYNCVPFDLCIDASDLAKLAGDLGHPCTLTSKADGFSKEDILAWFGMVQTENSVDVGGLLYPEIVIVDKEQMGRAIGQSPIHTGTEPIRYRPTPLHLLLQN